MNNTRMLESINMILAMGVENLEANRALHELKETLEHDIRHEVSRSSGKLAQTKAAERIINTMKQNARNKSMEGTYQDGEKWAVCSGYHGALLNEKPNVVEAPIGTGEPLKVSKVIPAERIELLELPTVQELKAEIKIKKAEHKGQKGYAPRYDFGDALPMVDAQFLLDLLELLPDAKAWTTSRMNPTRSIIVFEADAGIGLLCPVRKV